MLLGLHFAVEVGLSPDVVASDSSFVVADVNSSKPLLSKLGLVFPHSSMIFESRQTNMVVDSLGKFAMSLDSNLFWIDNFLPT
ncbi:hypothetical protein ACOSQ2_002380 [Xanthoceras sorbifolium]